MPAMFVGFATVRARHTSNASSPKSRPNPPSLSTATPFAPWRGRGGGGGRSTAGFRPNFALEALASAPGWPPISIRMDFILVDRFGGGGTAPSHYSCIDAPTLVVRGPAYCRKVSGIAAAVQESRVWLQLVWMQLQIALIASCGAAAPQTSHVNLGGSRPRPPASLGGYRTPKHRTGDLVCRRQPPNCNRASLVGGAPKIETGGFWGRQPP